MQLSRGWWRFLLSWAAAVSLCVIISVGILQFRSPVRHKDALALKQHAAQAPQQSVSPGSATVATGQPSPAQPPAGSTQSAKPSALAVAPTQDVAPDPQCEILLQKLLRQVASGRTVSPVQDNALATWQEIRKQAQDPTPGIARAIRDFIDRSETRAEAEFSAGRKIVGFDLQTFADMAQVLLRGGASQSTPSDDAASPTIAARQSVPPGPSGDGSLSQLRPLIAGNPTESNNIAVAPPGPQPIVPRSGPDASPPGTEQAQAGAPNAASPQLQRLKLRVARDPARCPKAVCYKWHLISQRRKPPRHATVDLARLQLAPGLRASVDKGDTDLIVEAEEQHRTMHGRDTVILVATDLAGVRPHDGPL
jgi:hypothetical protein